MRLIFVPPVVLALFCMVVPSVVAGPCEPYVCDDATVAIWHFDEGYGEVGQDPCNGNYGTLSGPTWVFDGPFDAGLSFDGDDCAVVPDSPSLRITGYGLTIEAWVRMTTNQGYNTIVRKFYQTGGFGGYLLRITNGKMEGWFKWGAGDDAVYIVENEVFDYTGDCWYHVAFTYDGEYMRLYRGGVLLKEQAETHYITDDNADLYIGRLDANHGEFFHGDIAEIRISSVARTDFNLCFGPTASEPGTWGRVKSLYR